jgi:HSP20 family protein
MANIVRRNDQRDVARQGGEPFRVMRDLFNWDPFRELETPFRRLEEEGIFIPRFEVKETKDSYILRADLPGIKEEDVQISVTGNRLTVSGRRESEQDQEDDRYFVSERSYGAFTRSFTLPDGADLEHVRAEMKNGELSIVVPKKPEVQPKKISLSKNQNQPKG